MRSSQDRKAREHGISLMEVLLVVGLGTVLLAMIFDFIKTHRYHTVNQDVAEHVLALHHAAVAYVKGDLDNGSPALILPGVNDVLPLPIANIQNPPDEDSRRAMVRAVMANNPYASTCLLDVACFPMAGFSPVLPLLGGNNTLTVLLRGGGLSASGGQILDVITIGVANNAGGLIPESRLFEIAARMHVDGGYFIARNATNPCIDGSGQFESASGSFSIQDVDFLNFNALPVCTATPPQQGVGGVPVAFTRILFEEEIVPSALYRTTPGNNTMSQDLDMQSNDILNLAELQATTVNVGMDLSVAGDLALDTLILAPNTTITVPDTLRVTGQTMITGDLQTVDLDVGGDIIADDLVAAQNLQITGSAQAASFQAQGGLHAETLDVVVSATILNHLETDQILGMTSLVATGIFAVPSVTTGSLAAPSLSGTTLGIGNVISNNTTVTNLNAGSISNCVLTANLNNPYISGTGNLASTGEQTEYLTDNPVLMTSDGYAIQYDVTWDNGVTSVTRRHSTQWDCATGNVM